MSLAERKLALIEAVIKIDDDELLDEIALIFKYQREANTLPTTGQPSPTSQPGEGIQGHETH